MGRTQWRHTELNERGSTIYPFNQEPEQLWATLTMLQPSPFCQNFGMLVTTHWHQHTQNCHQDAIRVSIKMGPWHRILVSYDVGDRLDCHQLPFLSPTSTCHHHGCNLFVLIARMCIYTAKFCYEIDDQMCRWNDHSKSLKAPDQSLL